MKISVINIAIILTLFSFIGFSQEIHIEGVNMHISENISLTIESKGLVFENHNGNDGQMHLEGTLFISDSITNNNLSSSPFADPGSNEGKVVFYGDGDSFFNGTNTIEIHNLDISKTSGGLHLNSPVIVHGQLHLSGGIIYSNNGHPLTLEAGASLNGGGGNGASHVQGEMVKKADATDNAFIFPLGQNSGAKSNVYRPVGFSELTGPATFTARHVGDDFADAWNIEPLEGNEVNGTSISHVSHVEYWELVMTEGSAEAKVILSWDEAYSQVTEPASLLAALWIDGEEKSSGAWRNLGATNMDEEENLFESFLTTSEFGVFTIASSNTLENPLPVELLWFEGECYDNNIELTWATASETNNSHFELYRSYDGSEYELITFIPGAGNSNSLIQYQHEYNSIAPGKIYFSLEQQDYDGDRKQLDMIAVDCDPCKNRQLLAIEKSLSFHDQHTFVVSNGYQFDAQWRLINLHGIVINSGKINSGIHNVDFLKVHLTSGVYVFVVNNSFEVDLIKFVVR